MIKIINTPNLTGIQLTGSFDDVHELYESLGRLIGSGLRMDEDNIVTLRIQSICYDLRHCYMGDRELEFVDNGYHEELQKYYQKIHPNTNVEFSVKLLWLEVIFAVLALDDYINNCEDDRLFKKRFKDLDLPEEVIDEFTTNRYKDIALAKVFQELVWLALKDACGNNAYKRLRKFAKQGQDVYYKPMRYTGFITHYIDTLEVKYLQADREKRVKLLATMIRKIMKQDEDYLAIAREIRIYSLENEVPYHAIRMDDESWPEDIEW